MASIRKDYPPIGTRLNWSQVQEYGGERSYLAKRGADIVCATLHVGKNPGAPEIISVGDKDGNIVRAENFCVQKGDIPVFLRRAKNVWEYAGIYTYRSDSKDPRDLEEWREKCKAVAVPTSTTRLIYLSFSGSNKTFLTPDDDVQPKWREGNRKEYLHRRPERKPGLRRAKLQAHLKKHGKIFCEACGFVFQERYKAHGKHKGPGLGNACEVHHNVLLSSHQQEVRNGIDDLSILCSNCHTAIHLISPMPLVDQFRKFIVDGK